MNILVTGGAGFIGSHLVRALLARDHRVRVLDNLDPQVHGVSPGRPEGLPAEAELRVADVRDREALRAALEGVDAVFHQAAVVGVGQSMYEIERYVSANSLGAAVLLEEVAARRDRIRRLIVASSMSLYGEGAYETARGERVNPPLRSTAQLEARRYELQDANGRPLRPVPTPESKPLQPTSVYAITKRDHEEMCRAVGTAYGIPTVALRYFNVYGPGQALSNPYTGVIAIFASRLLNGRSPKVFEDGLQTRDFVHVSDIVQANLLALERDEAVGGVYNVGTGVGTSVLEVGERLARELGARSRPQVLGTYRAGDIRHCVADVSAIQKDLGYAPAVDLGDGLRELLDWLRSQSPEDRVEAAHAELVRRGLAR